MGEVLKDIYEKDYKKRSYKDKFGDLMYRYAVVNGLIDTYTNELNKLNEEIKQVLKDVANENS